MKKKKLYLAVESVLCALAAGLLAAAAVRMYADGAAAQASGGPFAYIFTREKVGAALMQLSPVIAALIGFTAAGWALGIRDEEADRPAVLKGMDVRTSVARAVPQKTRRAGRVLRIAIVALAIALIVLGVRNGGLEDVLAKGASVCTECVGLG